MESSPSTRIGRPRPRTAVVALLAGVLAAGAAGVPAAAAASVPKPTIRSFAAAPKRLSASGGPVRLTVRVRGASRCTFRGQSAAFTTLNRVKTVSCASGRASVVLTVKRNVRLVPATIHYYVRASLKGHSVQRALTVTQAALSPPAATTQTPPAQPAPTPAPTPTPTPPATPQLAVTTTSLPGASLGAAYTATLAASGGTAPYTWTVSSGALPAGISLSLDGALTGTPIASGAFTFTVEVADSALESTTASVSIAVAVPGLPVQGMDASKNWSGYSVDGGPFTAVTGTFTVPGLGESGGQRVNTSEWVGIDGASVDNNDLIQAGVAETYSRFGGPGVYAWWEILPATETRIALEVKTGDTVTVTISQQSVGQWSIRIVDVTTGESFSTVQSYTGRTISAEWVVEAPSDSRNQVVTLGQYAPPVTFTHLGWAGSATSFMPIQMRQGGVAVSTPSPLASDRSGFAVAYGAVAPPAPG